MSLNRMAVNSRWGVHVCVCLCRWSVPAGQVGLCGEVIVVSDTAAVSDNNSHGSDIHSSDYCILAIWNRKSNNLIRVSKKLPQKSGVFRIFLLLCNKTCLFIFTFSLDIWTESLKYHTKCLHLHFNPCHTVWIIPIKFLNYPANLLLVYEQNLYVGIAQILYSQNMHLTCILSKHALQMYTFIHKFHNRHLHFKETIAHIPHMLMYLCTLLLPKWLFLSKLLFYLLLYSIFCSTVECLRLTSSILMYRRFRLSSKKQ